MLKLFISSLLLSALPVSALAADCSAGSPSERLACLQQQTCPSASTDAELLNCYRSISMTLLGEQSEPAVETPESAAAAATPAPPPVRWLSATDNITPAPAPAVPASSPEPAVVLSAPDDVPATSSNPSDDFGLREPIAFTQKKQEEPNAINAVIVQLQKQGRGNYLIVLDNGQLWEENEPTRSTLKDGQKVRIIKRTLNTYKLVPESGRATNVHRIACGGGDNDPRCALLQRS